MNECSGDLQIVKSKLHVYWYKPLYVLCTYVTRFAKTGLVHTDKVHFSPLINCYTNELTIHVYIIANG